LQLRLNEQFVRLLATNLVTLSRAPDAVTADCRLANNLTTVAAPPPPPPQTPTMTATTPTMTATGGELLEA
jgi:hypothetical protein